MSIWANVRAEQNDERALEELVIVGSGPAGYTAALYAARAKLAPLVLEGHSPGGLLQNAELVENFPGYPTGVLGPQLVADLRDQAQRFGARFRTVQVERLQAGNGAEPHRLWADEREIAARAVILATGAAPRALGVPGERELGAGRGIAYCAVCEAPLYAGRETIVIGGGDSAMEEALGLARHARSVILVHRRQEFSASPIMLERVRESEAIEIQTPYAVAAFEAGADGSLARAIVRHTENGSTRELRADGAFIAIGHLPASSLVRDLVELDGDGYVKCRAGSRQTSVAGIFACGDVVDRRYRQAITAAASGCEAALDAQRYLESARFER